MAIKHISDHVPIAVGFSWGRASLVSLIKGEAPFNGNYESYFGPDCIKDYVKDLLEIETEINFKLTKPRYLVKINYTMIPKTFVIFVINLALKKLEITVVKQVNIEVLHAIFVI